MEIARCTPNTIDRLPALPGIYTFYSHKEALLYVGKAKDIRKRVSDYFLANKLHSLKTQCMVKQVASIAYTVVDSEYDALLLENNLIKKLQPKYNILLKDGKTYPYLCITYERFPKLILTRKVLPSLGKYYGPFTSTQSIKRTLEVIRKLFTFRTCSYNLSEKNIIQKKFKVCLDYHLGLCKGPCQAFQDELSYQKEISQIEALLKNNFAPIKKVFKEKMGAAVQLLDYKTAQHCKEKLSLLAQYQAKSLVANPLVGDLDVVAIVADQDYLFVAYLHIQMGAVSFAQQRVFTRKLEEKVEDLITLIVYELRSCTNSNAAEVLVNIPCKAVLSSFVITMPKIGDKRKLVALALQNALLCKKDFLYKKTHHQDNPPVMLLQLQHDLKLKELPYCIECFDNSNIYGQHPVAAMVCFKNGKPSKKDYRHYNIKTVVGADDCASMHEVITRRYSYLVATQAAFPQLIVIDGGKAQLNATVAALQQIGVYGQIAVISIAKRLELLYFPNDALPICLPKQALSLKLLQQLRNEAHRFALAFHRKKRTQALTYDEWEAIPGIGPKTLTKLWKQFHTPAVVQSASLEALVSVMGPTKAQQLYTYLHNRSFENDINTI
ncbi:excinuclease ABC subunit UvrC [Candidatus Cardinium hertigii]|uniref:UvrABC system protein C n=1 Tax=Candidatus Cardinium hertigii TaxID=247481 RepID=A0A2Z3L960_9BACT|nr:excinuclease ABC subunit UvrC [Candidatus Cardinium hertigii]AWN81909.1 UvrABC system protein C [Candidatus Cardinium hertigii]